MKERDWGRLAESMAFETVAVAVALAAVSARALNEMGQFSEAVGEAFESHHHDELAAVSRAFGVGFKVTSLPIKLASDLSLVFSPRLRREVNYFLSF